MHRERPTKQKRRVRGFRSSPIMAAWVGGGRLWGFMPEGWRAGLGGAGVCGTGAGWSFATNGVSFRFFARGGCPTTGGGWLGRAMGEAGGSACLCFCVGFAATLLR